MPALLDQTPDIPVPAAPTEVEVVCPNCAARYRLARSLLGRRLLCRFCQEVWRPRSKPAGESPARSSSNDTQLIPQAGESDSIVIDTNWAGRMIGRYAVVSLLGRGGMGVVWRARDDALHREVALKILNRPDARKSRAGLDIFLQEARAAAKLQHPHVVTVHEVGEDQGQNYIALELMHGGTLKDVVEREGPLPPRTLFSMLIGPAKALALAHRRGIIHRDVKPGNLMFDDHGHLKLADFGLADVSGDPASLHLRGRSVGSLGWIAPEVAAGGAGSPASDIYSFGLSVLFGLTGQQWLKSDSRSRLIALHKNPPPLDLSELPPLTEAGVRLINRCLAVQPEDRFGSADELITALEAASADVPRPTSPPRLRKRTRLAYILIGAIIGALLAAVLLLKYGDALLTMW